MSPAITGFALPLAVSVFRVSVPIAWVAGVLFLGRLYGVHISVPALLGLVVTSAFISFSVPGIPNASLFLIAPVLVSLGLPAEGVGNSPGRRCRPGHVQDSIERDRASYGCRGPGPICTGSIGGR